MRWSTGEMGPSGASILATAKSLTEAIDHINSDLVNPRSFLDDDHEDCFQDYYICKGEYKCGRVYGFIIRSNRVLFDKGSLWENNGLSLADSENWEWRTPLF